MEQDSIPEMTCTFASVKIIDCRTSDAEVVPEPLSQQTHAISHSRLNGPRNEPAKPELEKKSKPKVISAASAEPKEPVITVTEPQDTIPKVDQTQLGEGMTTIKPGDLASSFVEPKGSVKGTPRRGGESRRTWWCCICHYLNKSGMYEVCSNPESEQCRGAYGCVGRERRVMKDRYLNHRRCEGCKPARHIDWYAGNTRRWDDDMPEDEWDELFDKAMDEFAKVNSDFWAAEFERTQAKTATLTVRRDPITYMIIDESDKPGSLDYALQERIRKNRQMRGSSSGEMVSK